MMTRSNTFRPDFPSRLEVQRLNEQLSAAQEKLKRYEDLIANLYHQACENCKETFQRIADASMSSPAANTVVVSPHESSSCTMRFYNRLLAGLQIWFPWSAAPISPPEPGSPQPSPSHVSSPDENPNLDDPSVSTHPPEAEPSNNEPIEWSVEFRGLVKPPLEVKLEHVWTPECVVVSVKFSPNGKYLAAGLGLGLGGEKTYIYDVKTKRKICVLANQYARKRQAGACFLAFSPDARYLGISQIGKILIWEVRKKHVRNALRAVGDPRIPFSCIDFSPDGRFVVGGSQRASIRIWCLHDGSSFVLGDNPYYTATAVKFSPDGKYVANSGLDGNVFLWNVRTRKLVRKWEAHDQEVWTLAFTPDGKKLVTGGSDMRLKFWDIGQPGSHGLKAVSEFAGHTSHISSVAISPDSRWLASGAYDCTSRFWDIGDVSVDWTLLGHKGEVQAVDFSPSGKYLACGSWDGNVSLWKYE